MFSIIADQHDSLSASQLNVLQASLQKRLGRFGPAMRVGTYGNGAEICMLTLQRAMQTQLSKYGTQRELAQCNVAQRWFSHVSMCCHSCFVRAQCGVARHFSGFCGLPAGHLLACCSWTRSCFCSCCCCWNNCC